MSPRCVSPQMDLPLTLQYSWGGERPGAGRKRVRSPGVAHRSRDVSGREPLHITLRVVPGIPNLRNPDLFGSLRAVIFAARERFGFRVAQYSVQSNHFHFIAEADDDAALQRGTTGLQVRIARTINKYFDRKGPVFSERYHIHVLRTPREVRNALVYVLANGKKHALELGQAVPDDSFDPYSSFRSFDGWTVEVDPPEEPHVARATTWLLVHGWQRHGRISPSELPAT